MRPIAGARGAEQSTIHGPNVPPDTARKTPPPSVRVLEADAPDPAPELRVPLRVVELVRRRERSLTGVLDAVGDDRVAGLAGVDVGRIELAVLDDQLAHLLHPAERHRVVQ